MRRGDWIKLIWLLAAVVVLLLLIAYAEISERRGVARKQSELTAFYPEVKASDVGYISLQKGTVETELKREGEQWLVKLPDGRWFPAAREDLDEILDYFVGLVPAELISTDHDKLGKFELTNEMALTVKLAASPDAEEPLAVVKLGKAGPDFRSVYARKDDLSEAYLLAGSKASLLGRPAEKWRDRHPFLLKQEEIAGFTIERAGKSFTILKGGDGRWMFAEEEAVPVDQNKVVEFLARLAGLVAIRLNDEETPEMGLARPDFVITATVGAEEVAVSVSPEAEESKRFVKNSKLNQIYELAASTFVDFPLTREFFEQKKTPVGTEGKKTDEIGSDAADAGATQ